MRGMGGLSLTRLDMMREAGLTCERRKHCMLKWHLSVILRAHMILFRGNTVECDLKVEEERHT